MEYARYIFGELEDAVDFWTTFNEPWVTAFVGHWYGSHPPGIRDPAAALRAAHNILLAHGMTVRAFREMGLKGEIGISLNLNPVYPASENLEDMEAALRCGDFYNGWFLDPILKGNYPERLVRWLSDKVALPGIEEGDMEIIRAPIDFLGVNTYSVSSIRSDLESWPFRFAFANTGKARTDSGWEIYPEGLSDLLLYLHEEYDGIKMMITENGAAFKDAVGEDGRVDDPDRIRYIRDHIVQAHKALTAGVRLAGYYVWSFLDNFEWNMGYSKRFGLVYVDYPTQQRIVKQSGWWYKEVIGKNGINEQG